MARAVRFDHYGGRDVLYIADVEIPKPSEGQVVVEVRAAGINPGEAAIRSGALEKVFPATFPSGEGSDLAGTVSSLGEGVTEFAVGDEVLGWSWQRSSQAEYVAVPVDQLIRKPPSLSWEVAGSLYVVGCTAYAAVRAVDVHPGDTVAVSAAAGGVGTVVVQLLGQKGRVGARHRVGEQFRLVDLARRDADLLREWTGRPSEGGRTERHRRLHRPLWPRVRAARSGPRCLTRSYRDHHLAREGARGWCEDGGKWRRVDHRGAVGDGGTRGVGADRDSDRRHVPAGKGARCVCPSWSNVTLVARSS